MHRVASWVWIVLLFGCSGQKPPPLSIKIAHAAQAGLCFPMGTRPSDEALTTLPISLLRLSLRRHAAGEVGGSFACDRVLQVPSEQPTLEVFASAGETFDLFAEGFAKAPDGDPDTATVGPWRRVATGSLFGVDLTQTNLSALRLYPISDFRCVDARLTQARAFHTATVLPTGQVLILGGLVASPTDAAHETVDADTFWVTSSAELYDPADGSFTQLAGPGLQPRAFHHATLVNSAPPYQILLTGGITSSDPTGMQPQLAKNNGAKQDAARLAPEIPGLVPTELPTKAAGPELIVFDPFQKTLARASAPPTIPAAAFQGAVPATNGVAVAGGLDYGMGATSDLTQSNKLYVSNGTTVKTAQLTAQRVGPAMTKLGGDSALVWGGELTTVDAMMKPVPIGDVISGLTSAAPAITAANPPGLPPVLFPTASTFATTGNTASVLVTGGFELQSGRVAIQPPLGMAGQYILNVNGTAITPGAVTLDGWVSDMSCMNADRFRPAGYEDALVLPGRDGEVLVTGGAPRFDTCNDCEDNVTPGPFCSLHQASRFVPPATLSRLPAMQVGRFGHATAVLPDGNVLVTGGVELPPNSDVARLVGDAEVFNPRGAEPRLDSSQNDRDDPLHDELTNLMLVRAPGDVARDPANGNMQARACPNLQ
jgi:hypothetical protein